MSFVNTFSRSEAINEALQVASIINEVVARVLDEMFFCECHFCPVGSFLSDTILSPARADGPSDIDIGVFTHSGVRGVTQHTIYSPRVTARITELLSQRFPHTVVQIKSTCMNISVGTLKFDYLFYEVSDFHTIMAIQVLSSRCARHPIDLQSVLSLTWNEPLGIWLLRRDGDASLDDPFPLIRRIIALHLDNPEFALLKKIRALKRAIRGADHQPFRSVVLLVAFIELVGAHRHRCVDWLAELAKIAGGPLQDPIYRERRLQGLNPDLRDAVLKAADIMPMFQFGSE